MKWVNGIALLVLGGCFAGCKGYTQHGSSEWGFKYSQQWAFYQQTEAADPEDESSLKLDVAVIDDVVDLVDSPDPE